MTDNNHGLFKKTIPDQLAKVWLVYMAPTLLIGLVALNVFTARHHKDEVIQFTPTPPKPMKCYVVPDCYIGERPDENL